ncbi:MAG TPA: NB-ARC domain-containing protein [Pseudonocardiaceae bacterium]|nr:NB-ARC domain-containing protein [Pseudonocardiaceae bacterium]
MSGQAVQAGAIHGDVYFQQQVTDRPQVIPRQLLRPPANFANRHRELSALDDMLAIADGGPRIAVLKGPGGVGKTALALHWLSGLPHRFPDGQLFAELTLPTGEPVLVDDVLGQFLRALGVAPKRVPTGLAERAALYRSMTSQARLAVLLDNAMTAAQVRVLLPASAGAVVVTSRRSLAGLLVGDALSVRVDPLDEEAGLALLAGSIGAERISAEDATARQLVDLCAGLPLALRVAGARVVSRPRRPLTRLVDELVDERQRLDALSVPDDLSVRSTFDVAYAELSPAQQRVYRAMGVHPGIMFGAEVIAAATDASAARRIDDLADASLVEETADGRYQLHNLVRVHAQEQIDHQERAAMTLRIVRWYLYATRTAAAVAMPARRMPPSDAGPADGALPDGLDDPVSALRWLELNRLTLIEVVRAAHEAGSAQLTYQLADALQPLFIVHHHDRDTVVVGEIALAAAETLQDWDAENNVRKRLVRAYAALGEPDRAVAGADDMLEITRRRGDRRGEASAIRRIALLQLRLGNREAAVAAFEDGLLLMNEVGRRRGAGLTLIDLGRTLAELGRFDEARARLDSAREILAALPAADEYNAARAAAALGMVLARSGAVAEAGRLLAGALRAFESYGSDYEAARTHRWLAELAYRTGDDHAAEQHQEAARALGYPPEE